MRADQFGKGSISVRSQHAVDETVGGLKQELDARGVKVFAVWTTAEKQSVQGCKCQTRSGLSSVIQKQELRL
jgi:uncharacterized protein (DUF302 family)